MHYLGFTNINIFYIKQNLCFNSCPNKNYFIRLYNMGYVTDRAKQGPVLT